MQKIKVNDQVEVIAGKDKGKQGKVQKVDVARQKVLVEGVNLFKKAVKPTQDNPQGGHLEVSRYLHLSNVMCLSPKTGKPTRVKIAEKDGKRVRIAVKCGSVL